MAKKKHAVFYLLSVFLFGLLCYLAHEYHIWSIDQTISLWLQKINSDSFRFILEGVSNLTGGVSAALVVVIIAGLLWFLARRIEAIFLVSLVSFGALVNLLFKLLVNRPRPYQEFVPGLGENMSFPSGHTTYTIVLFGFLFYLAPRLLRSPAAILILRLLLVTLIILTALSRVYLNAHWPSDILGSVILGGLILIPFLFLYNNRVEKTRKDD